MNNKTKYIEMLHDEYNRWETLLADLTPAQITAPQLPSNLSVHDVIAHLYAWQQRSVAKMQAGLDHTEPQFPLWVPGVDPDGDNPDPADTVNAFLYDTYHNQPWDSVYQAWRDNFQRFLELADAIPEADMLDPQMYTWLDGEPLANILYASYDHHHNEHYEPLTEWLRAHQIKVSSPYTKPQLVTMLRDMYARWEHLLARRTPAQISTPTASDLSIQDTIAHLYAWQQRSVARMEAARDNTPPVYPRWAQDLGAASEPDTDTINARIFNLYHAEAWATVYALWRDNFQRFLDLAEQATPMSLFDTAYPWLNGYLLADVLIGSYEHHKEHLEPLLAKYA